MVHPVVFAWLFAGEYFCGTGAPVLVYVISNLFHEDDDYYGSHAVSLLTRGAGALVIKNLLAAQNITCFLIA